ncbi:MAG: PD-(D/E)XK nuclease family protein [Deltaproteobacteria bacterium]|jgi:hypothetical protein|nr:PD-(D/E)XK nuclease family protein [Deltaproteobacteria bacterium]
MDDSRESPRTARCEDFFARFRALYTPFFQAGGEIRFWDLAALGTDELRNTSILGWLLDQHASHGQGDAFFRLFLEALRASPGCPEAAREALPGPEQLGGGYGTRLEISYESPEDKDSRPGSRVDLEMEGRSMLLFIEAKVYAGETGNQLARYAAILDARKGGRAHGLVFLTPEGRPPQEEILARKVVCVSWRHIARHMSLHAEKGLSASRSSGETRPPFWAELARQYCRHISQM